MFSVICALGAFFKKHGQFSLCGISVLATVSSPEPDSPRAQTLLRSVGAVSPGCEGEMTAQAGSSGGSCPSPALVVASGGA